MRSPFFVSIKDDSERDGASFNSGDGSFVILLARRAEKYREKKELLLLACDFLFFFFDSGKRAPFINDQSFQKMNCR